MAVTLCGDALRDYMPMSDAADDTSDDSALL